MEEIFKSILLGVIQGITEFLPVSSSGHLELGKTFLNLDIDPDESILLTVVLHFATALSTVIVFWKDILEIAKGLVKKRVTEEWKFCFKIILSMIPAAFVGVYCIEFMEKFFHKNILLVALMLIVTGVLLLLADRAKNTGRSVGWLHSLIIGIAQAIAILPGISRSGATISTSVLLGIDRAKAARFSFLMVVPLIFAKIAKDLLSGEIITDSISFSAMGLGFIAAFITGLIACKWMIVLVKKCQLKWFAYYCFAVAFAVISYLLVDSKFENERETKTALVTNLKQY